MAVAFSTAELVADFTRVAAFPGILIPAREIVVEECPAPTAHPPSCRQGCKRSTCFSTPGGASRSARRARGRRRRYCNHHYGVNRAPSTLARSLVAAQSTLGLSGINESTVGAWIPEQTDRVNLLLPARYGVLALSLLEVFAQCRLQPALEGFASRRPIPITP